MTFELPLAGVPEMLGAFALALPIGWEREKHDRSMGLRTFPLLAVASCAFLVIAQEMSPGQPGEWNRTLQGIATGVGFIGAGAIVKHGLNVLGTATAASVWMTAALGAAAALGLWNVAVTLSLLGFVTLRLLHVITPTDQPVDRGDVMRSADTPEPERTR
ncbi:MAG: MgtC/SapB family protein [Deltaproteobacteria bacterium]|nr:MgtC/SapB family protein [Kofleriaceae bacterium]